MHATPSGFSWARPQNRVTYLLVCVTQFMDEPQQPTYSGSSLDLVGISLTSIFGCQLRWPPLKCITVNKISRLMLSQWTLCNGPVVAYKVHSFLLSSWDCNRINVKSSNKRWQLYQGSFSYSRTSQNINCTVKIAQCNHWLM